MKKSIKIMLTVLLCMLGLAGCNNSVSENTPTDVSLSMIAGVSVDEPIKLSEEDAKAISEILENGEWKDGLSACATDYILVVSDDTIAYHSECGTFNNNQNKRSLSTDEDTKKAINDILGNYVTSEQ